MEQIVYDGKMKIARTKYGLFVRGKPEEFSDIEAKEILKLADFHKASFSARYMGKGRPRSIRVGSKIYVCPVGKWTKLPLSIMYKIRSSKEFEVAGDKVIPLEPKKIEKPREIAKRPVHKPKKKKIKSIKPAPVAKIEREEFPQEIPQEEKKPIAVTTIDKLGLTKLSEIALKKAGIKDIWDANKLSDAELLNIKGVGPSTLRKIRGG